MYTTNKLKNFISLNKLSCQFIIVTFIFSIIMLSLGIQNSLLISKILYIASAILFFCSSIYTLFYSINKYKNNLK